MPTDKEELLEELKNKFDDLNYRWNIERNKLEAKAQHLSADARKTFEEKQQEFSRIRDEMKIKINDLEFAGEKAWGDIREGAEKTWTALSEAFEKAISHFKK